MGDSADDPDTDFRLDQAIRARIPAHFDADALERLLQRVPASSRLQLLAEFATPAVRTLTALAAGSPILTRISHPVLQDLLEQVWQPFWDRVPDRFLDDPASPYPGQARARARRRGAG